MLLDHDQAMRFIEGYKLVLLQVLKTVGENPSEGLLNALAKARHYLQKEPQLLMAAIESLAAEGRVLEENIEKALHSLRIGRWFYLRSTTKYAIMLDEKYENAYAVKALTTSIDDLIGGGAALIEVAIFEYDGMFVCDGLITNIAYLGANMCAEMDEAYRMLKAKGRFHKRCALIAGLYNVELSKK